VSTADTGRGYLDGLVLLLSSGWRLSLRLRSSCLFLSECLFNTESDAGYHQQTETSIEGSRRGGAAVAASGAAAAVTGSTTARGTPAVVVAISAIAVAIVVAVAAAAVIAMVAGCGTFGVVMAPEQIHEVVPGLVDPALSMILM